MKKIIFVIVVIISLFIVTPAVPITHVATFTG